jgi:peroxiredoxin (alkyl hydroperoxide reductase subunit C)
MSAGRSIDEILRLVQALQVADKQGVACPAEWKPGQKVIVPPPKTKADAEARMRQEGLDRKDWYFSEKAPG